MTLPESQLGPLRIPAEGLGCVGMSELYGTPDEREAVATIRRAIELGVALLDTADSYGVGDNERLIGRAIADRRSEVVVATKFGLVRNLGDLIYTVDARPERVAACCDASLARLGVEVIDLYYLHRVDPRVPIEETVGAMSDLVSRGKVRHVGLSEASAETIRRAHRIHPITAVQSEWSLFARGIEHEVVPTCRELNIGIVAYSPLGRGLLTGALTTADQLEEGDLRRALPWFQEGNIQRNLQLVARVKALADELGCTAGQLALAWLHARGRDVVPIPGTKRTRYLEENIAALNLTLDPAHLAELDDLTATGAVAGDRHFDLRWHQVR